MHVHYVENEHGHVQDVIPFCSDSCHREYCKTHSDIGPYTGWNGCNEGGDYPEFCANCGVYCGGKFDCDHQRDNVVVNRFRCEDGEKCEHGHWIQLPSKMIP